MSGWDARMSLHRWFGERAQKWLVAAAKGDATGADALTLMEEFCEDAGGYAEFSLRYELTADGDLRWSAEVLWEGYEITDETDHMSGRPYEAVWDAIQRTLRHLEAQ